LIAGTNRLTPAIKFFTKRPDRLIEVIKCLGRAVKGLTKRVKHFVKRPKRNMTDRKRFLLLMFFTFGVYKQMNFPRYSQAPTHSASFI